jgi:hypothetical protein
MTAIILEAPRPHFDVIETENDDALLHYSFGRRHTWICVLPDCDGVHHLYQSCSER